MTFINPENNRQSLHVNKLSGDNKYSSLIMIPEYRRILTDIEIIGISLAAEYLYWQ